MPGQLTETHRLRPFVTLAVAVAWASWVAMFCAKLFGVGVQLDSPFGRAQLLGSSPWISSLALATPDFLAAALWAVLVTVTLGWAARKRTRTARIVLGGLNLLLATVITVGVVVYQLFATHPTIQLFQSLRDAGDTSSSVVAFLDGKNVATWLGFALVTVGGTELLLRLLRRASMKRLAVAGGVFVGLCLVFLLPGALAPVNATELDKNGPMQLVASCFQQPEETVGGDESDLLRALVPIQTQTTAQSPTRAYKKLARWFQERPRNIVLVILEGAAPAHLQLLDGKHANTPRLVSMAKRGVLWPRHYAHSPNSMSAIYSILCGNYSRPGGRTITFTVPRINCQSLSEILSTAGMRTSLWHSSFFHSRRKNRFLEGRGWDALHDVRTLPGVKGKWRNSWGVEEAVTIDAALSWISKASSRPFFVTYIPVQTHHPYAVPDPKYKKFKLAGDVGAYTNVYYYMDQMLGRLIDGLRAAGLEDDTLVLVVGDHGEAFEKHPGSRVHGGDLYDENVRSFALWYAPGALSEAYVDARPMGHVDLAPTLTALLGLKKSSAHPGVSATELGTRPMVALYTMEGRPHRGFVDGQYKYINKRGAAELFDLLADPDEQRSLADDRPSQITAYKNRVPVFAKGQRAWERALGVLAEGAKALSVDTKLSVALACDLDAKKFVVDKGRIRKLDRGVATFECYLALPPHPVRLVRLVLRGRDRVGGGRVDVSVSFMAANGDEWEIGYGRLDGDRKTPMIDPELRLVGARTKFSAGGKLIVRLRVTQGADADFADFSIEGLDAYVHNVQP